MANRTKFDSRELGLAASYLLGSYFFKTDHLHYGYWPDNLEVNNDNFAQAQQLHSDLIISHIPENVKTILDVGCGAGALSRELIDKGYIVDCVSPSPVLTRMCRQKLGDQVTMFEVLFKDISTDKHYDLVLFSESFQYVKLPEALFKIQKILNKSGFLLICDFFKTDAPGKSALSGGHRLSSFRTMMLESDFSMLEDIDITKQTAPNLDLIDNFLQSVGRPLWDLVLYYGDTNYPRLMKLVKWKYRKKIKRISDRYLSGERNAESFKIFKSYRLMLYTLTTTDKGIKNTD